MRERYASGLSDDTAKQMVELLNHMLANTIDLTLDGKQCHWNLQGSGFIGVHRLLDDTTERLREVSATIAERIVILGSLMAWKHVAKETELPQYPTDFTKVDQHVRHLTDRYKQVAQMLRMRLTKQAMQRRYCRFIDRSQSYYR